MARLPRLMGRQRALEVLLSSNDIGGDLAEAYGYVNRSLPDSELDGFVDALATRCRESYLHQPTVGWIRPPHDELAGGDLPPPAERGRASGVFASNQSTRSESSLGRIPSTRIFVSGSRSSRSAITASIPISVSSAVWFNRGEVLLVPISSTTAFGCSPSTSP